MSFLDQFKEAGTGKRYPVQASVSSPREWQNPNVPKQDASFDVSSEYVMSATVYTHFTCTQAEYQRAKRDAEAMLCHAMFKDIVQELMLLNQDIAYGDTPAAQSRVSNLIATLRGVR